MKIILLSLYNQPKIIMNYLEIGINGMLLKQFNSNQVCQTIDGVYLQGYYFTEAILNSISLFHTHKSPIKLISFSGIQLKIITGICNEMTSTSMSEKFFLSKSAIDWHRNKIKIKIGAKSTIGIVKYAIIAGLFIP